MRLFHHFSVAAYVHAEFLHFADEAAVEKGIQYFAQYLPLNKVYLETHRGLYDIPKEKMARFKKLFQDSGIAVSGGITSTAAIEGHKKNNVFDVFCFTDPVYRERYLDIVRSTAEQFDEIILDDFFFTACRCKMCIAAKGKRSWSQFRLDQMEEMAKLITAEAKKVNPRCRFIIKYPNWYESYQACGYNPGKQKDIFDGIYTGTESRNPKYDQQHLQRYLSYSLLRLMENIAPDRNGGGWIDQGGSFDNLNVWLEEATLTLLAGAKELMLFNFHELIDSTALPPLRRQLERVDAMLEQTGSPQGVSLYEPYDADGEDQLVNYMGMTGIPFEPVPYFDEKAPVLFLPASAAKDPQIAEKTERYVAHGGTAVVTTGFLRAVKAMEDMTSVRLTGRRAAGREYWIDSYYANRKVNCAGMEDVTVEVLDYKTNASWCEVALVSGDCNFPLLVHEFYGDGHLMLLNVPDNFGDLYKLPKDVLSYLAKLMTKGRPVYLNAEAKYNLFTFDNDTFCVASYRPYGEDVEIILRGEDITGILDLESGARYTPYRENWRPVKRFDSAKTESEPLERAVTVPMMNGACKLFRLLRE